MAVVPGALGAPMWFAFPPEVHSALLSTGPGPGPLLVAAEAWRALATEYTLTATELESTLAATEASAWEGPTAAQYVAAHQPFLSWLHEVTATANAATAGHETAAAGYASALASMPTLAELAANHAIHGILVATSFFGINTIPIALNEADYIRMWIQAAATMSVYHGVATATLASIPTTSTAPHIVTTESAPAAGSSFPDPTKAIIGLLQDFLNTLSNMAAHYLPGPLGSLVPQLLQAFVAFTSTQAFLIPAYSVLDTTIYFGPFAPLLALLTPFGLIGLVALNAESAPAVTGVHSNGPAERSLPAIAGLSLPGAGSATPAAGHATAPATSSANAVSSAPAAGAAQGSYVVGSDPGGDGFSPTSTTKAAAAVAAGLAPAAASLAARDQARAKRRAKARQRGHKYQYAFLDEGPDMAAPIDPAPDVSHLAASESGSRTLGFAGTVAKSGTAQAQGLTHLQGGEFDVVPREPMLPGTWTGDEPPNR